MRSSIVSLCAVIGLALSGVCADTRGAEPDTFDRHFRYEIAVEDSASRHVHPPDKAFSVAVTPFMVVGDNLASHARVAVTSPSTRVEIQHAELAAGLLSDDQDANSSATSVIAGFSKASDGDRKITVDVQLDTPATVKYLAIAGDTLHETCDVEKATVVLLDSKGKSTDVPLTIQRENGKWQAMFQQMAPPVLRSIKFELTTPGKIDLTHIEIRGREPNVRRDAVQPPFNAREWNGLDLFAFWQSAGGKRLSDPVPLQVGQAATIASPKAVPPGYYGLRVEGIQDTMTVFQKEFGFAVMPITPPPTQLRPDSMFGMVHMDLKDEYLHPAWTKTLFCKIGYDDQTERLNAKTWQAAVQERRDLGYEELPIAAAGWRSDPQQPVSDVQVQQLCTRMEQYFRATPDVLYYELGLEENIAYRNNGYVWPYFWANTEKKAKAVREVVQRVNPKIRLIYQVAEFDLRTLEEFCKSEAAKQFDILSMHPYAWETYPMPDLWQADLLHTVRGWMKEGGVEMPIWYTEVGAAHIGNPGGFFGYPGKPNVFDNGLSRATYSTYLTRLHVIAAAEGVQKLFWYNYADSGENSVYAERHFGLVDVWGFPKPGYVTYANLVRLLEGRTFVRKDLTKGVAHFVFHGPADNCEVLWTPDVDSSTVDVPIAADARVVDNFGGDVGHNLTVSVGPDPIFIIEK